MGVSSSIMEAELLFQIISNVSWGLSISLIVLIFICLCLCYDLYAIIVNSSELMLY